MLPNKDVVLIRIRKAKGRLKASKVLLEKELYEDSISRSYYAIFYSVKAILATRDIATKTHSGAKTMFGKEFLKTGIVPKELGKILDDAKRSREVSDYEDYHEATGTEARK
jgi:uncharacterized protein (UPF0332 family)